MEDRLTRNKRQNLLIFMCWLIYTVSYFGKYSYNSNANRIMLSFGVSHAQTGLATTLFFFAYGIGQVVNGIFCKHYNKRIILTVSLVCSALINGVIFLGVEFVFYKYVWLINGFLQSFLWSSLIQLLGEKLSANKLRTAVFVMSTTIVVGTAGIYGVSALFESISSSAWKYSFLFASVTMLFAGLVWFLFYKKFTENLSCEEVDGEIKEVKNSEPNSAITKTYFWVTLICMAFFATASSLVKDGLLLWVPSILTETYKLDESFSLILTIVLPIVGVLGAFTVRTLNKRTTNFVLIAGVFFVIVFGGLFAVTYSLGLYTFVPALIAFALVYASVLGLNNLVTGMTPLYLRSHMSSGLIAGMLNGFCYLGSTISSYGLGLIADVSGWNSVFIVLLVISGIALAISVAFVVRNFIVAKKNRNKNV